jgi:hypothetical protein
MSYLRLPPEHRVGWKEGVLVVVVFTAVLFLGLVTQ